MVAAAHPLAAYAGARILARGGNAFDGAVAVAAALSATEPFMSGLAGTGYATMWVAAERRVRVLDFVPPVPRSFPVDRFTSREQLYRGPMSVGLPGNLAGWCTLAQGLGRLPLADLLEPAARLAEGGVALAEYGAWEVEHQAGALRHIDGIGSDLLAAYPFAEGATVGTIMRQPDLARTLREIGRNGPGHLYGGPLGERLVQHLASMGGCLALGDLADVKAVWRDPLSCAYRDLVIHVPPPPSEAIQFLLTLRILDGTDIGSLAQNSAAHLDRMVRAIRWRRSAGVAAQRFSIQGIAVSA